MLQAPVEHIDGGLHIVGGDFLRQGTRTLSHLAVPKLCQILMVQCGVLVGQLHHLDDSLQCAPRHDLVGSDDVLPQIELPVQHLFFGAKGLEPHLLTQKQRFPMPRTVAKGIQVAGQQQLLLH